MKLLKILRPTKALLFCTFFCYSFFALSSAASAQSPPDTAFYQLEDLTGYDSIPKHLADSLNAAALRLRDALPQEFQSYFGVYDLGFYHHHSSYVGGIPDVITNAIANRVTHSYYLVFGRELDNEGNLKKVWVEMELPNTEDFCHWEDGTFSHMKFMVELKANVPRGFSASDKFPIFMAVKDAIQYMGSRVDQLVDCCSSAVRQSCDCGWSTDTIRHYFEVEGASFREIEVHDSLPFINHDCVCFSEFDSHFTHRTGSDYLVENYTGISSFTLDSIQFQISELMDSLAWLGSIYEANGMSFYAVITDNSVFCGGGGGPPSLRANETGSLNDVLDNYFGHEIGVWIHVFSEDGTNFELIENVNGIGGNILIDCSKFPQYCPQFNWIFSRLDNLNEGFYYNTIMGFCKENTLDLIFEIADFGQWQRGSSTPLEKVLNNKIVVNKISDNYFDQEVFCEIPTEGYLGAVKTILHEMVHAMLKRLLYSLPSGSYYQRYETLTNFNYAAFYIRYRSIYDIEMAVNYTEHEILIRSFLRDHMKDLRYFHKDNSIHDNSYFAFITRFSFNPWDGEMDFSERFKTFQIDTSFEPSTIYEYDVFMENLINKLNSNSIDQCEF